MGSLSSNTGTCALVVQGVVGSVRYPGYRAFKRLATGNGGAVVLDIFIG